MAAIIWTPFLSGAITYLMSRLEGRDHFLVWKVKNVGYWLSQLPLQLGYSYVILAPPMRGIMLDWPRSERCKEVGTLRIPCWLREGTALYLFRDTFQWCRQCKQWCSCQCWKVVMSLQEQFCDLGTWSWFVTSKPSGESVTCPISLNKIPFLLKLPIMYFYCLWPKRSNTLLLYRIPMVLEWLCQISSWDVDTSYQSHLQVCQSNNPVRKGDENSLTQFIFSDFVLTLHNHGFPF